MANTLELEMRETGSTRAVDDSRMSVSMLIIAAIFLLSPFGSVSTKIELGVISLSGLLTLFLFILVCFILLISKRIRWSLGTNLLMFLVLADVIRGAIQGYQIGNWQSLIVWFTAAAILMLGINVTTVVARRTFWSIVKISLLAVLVLLAYQTYADIDDPAAALLSAYVFPFVGLRAIRYRRIVYWPLLLVLLVFPIVTGAKIVLIANIFVLGLIVYRTWIRKQALRYKVLGVTCFVLLLVGLVFTGLGSSRFQQAAFEGDKALQLGGYSINSSGRVTAWVMIVESSLEKPFFGWGEDVPSTLRGDRWHQPHNEFLRILHHFGSVGIALLLVAIVAIRHKYRSRKPRTRFELQIYEWAGYSTWFLLVVSLTDNPLTYYYVLLPIVTLISMSLALAAVDSSVAPRPYSGRDCRVENGTDREHLTERKLRPTS